MCDIDDNGDELNQWWLYGDDDDDENSDDVDHDGDAHGVDGDAVSTLRFCHEWFNRLSDSQIECNELLSLRFRVRVCTESRPWLEYPGANAVTVLSLFTKYLKDLRL